MYCKGDLNMKTRLTLSDVSGITPEELRKYSKKDLLRVLAPIRDAANKRIGRLEKSGLNNIPALNAIRDTGGRIYGSQWTTNKELIKEIQEKLSVVFSQEETFIKRVLMKAPLNALKS